MDAYCTSGNSPTNGSDSRRRINRSTHSSKTHGAKRNGAGAPGLQAQSPDVLITPDGSVVLFQLLTSEAHAFVDEFVSTESWQWLGSTAFAVDYRFAPELASGMAEHGLAVRG